MNSDSSNSHDIRLVRIRSFQELLIKEKNKAKNRKYAEKSEPARDPQEENLPSSIINNEIKKQEKLEKKKKVKNEGRFVLLNNQTSPIEDLDISGDKTKKRNKLGKEGEQISSIKATHFQTEVFKNNPKNNETSDILVVSRKHKKNKKNSNDKTKYEEVSFKDTNVELDNSQIKSKRVNKDKSLKKSKKVSDNLSKLSKSSDATNSNYIRKRKRYHERSRILSSVEDILHKPKKVKSNANKYTSECTGKVQKDSRNKYKKKVNEEIAEKELLSDESFENRLKSECAKKTVEIKPEDVDIPFDNILEKLIKNQMKFFDKQTKEPVFKKQQVNNKVVTKVCSKNGGNVAHIENNCIDTEDKLINSRRKCDKAPKSHRKQKINSTGIKTEPSSVVTDKTTTYKSSKKKKLPPDKKTNFNIIKQELEIANNLAMDKLSIKTEDDTKGYINGIKLSTLQLSSLHGLIVTLPFMPHPVHMIETKLTNRPKPGQRKEIEALGYKLVINCYNSSEDTQILNNWKEFCELHTLDEDPGPFLVPNKYFPHQERVKFVQYLARGLEHRTLASVYKRFRLLSSSHLKKGKFSKEEDQIIFEQIALAEQQGLTNKDAKVFAKLATILHRGRLQIEKHYITLCKETA